VTMDPGEEPRLIHPKVAAAMLGFESTQHVYRLVREGRISPVARRPLRIPLSSLRAYAASRMDPPALEPEAAEATEEPVGPVPPAPAEPPMTTEAPVMSSPTGSARPRQRATLPSRLRPAPESWRRRMSRCQRCPRPRGG
jgi:hypothetical protein